MWRGQCVVQIWSDARFEAVAEPQRVALFREFKAVLGEVEAYQRSEAARQAEAARAAAEAQEKVHTSLAISTSQRDFFCAWRG